MVLSLKQVASQLLEWFHPDPDQPRKIFDLDELRLLASTLKVKQLVPVLAKPDGTLIDGERRWRAAMLEGRPSRLDVIITDDPLTAAEVKEIQLVTALHRADLTPYEQYLGCKSWMDANANATANDLAAKIGRNPSTVSRVLSLTRCIPAVQEAAQAGLLGISDWAAIAKVCDQEQHQLLAAKRSGSSRDELERQSRKTRNGSAPVVRLSRVKCQMASTCVTLAGEGEGLSLDDIIETLSNLLKEARKANDQGLSAKTFEKALKDKAKAGG